MAGGQVRAVFGDAGVVGVGQFFDELVCVNQGSGPADIIVAGIKFAVADVVGDGAAEEVRGLLDDAQLRLEPFKGQFLEVLTVDADNAGCGFVEAAGQVGDG